MKILPELKTCNPRGQTPESHICAPPCAKNVHPSLVSSYSTQMEQKVTNAHTQTLQQQKETISLWLIISTTVFLDGAVENGMSWPLGTFLGAQCVLCLLTEWIRMFPWQGISTIIKLFICLC